MSKLLAIDYLSATEVSAHGYQCADPGLRAESLDALVGSSQSVDLALVLAQLPVSSSAERVLRRAAASLTDASHFRAFREHEA